ncbi:MAG TPA: MFS transporter [Nocardioidaceae bacterium]|nr:MFS transporter [Nocardioidaceae bacterium]
MSGDRGRWSAYTVWLVYSGTWSFIASLSWTTTAVYLVRDVHMSPFELVLAGTAMELAYFIFEVPTGVLADVRSRRLSMIVGAGVMGTAMLVSGLVASAPVVLAAMALWGIGWTFRSGAEDAWLADEIGSARLGSAYQRSAQLDRVTGLLGIGAAVGLSLVDLSWPLIAAGICAFGLAAFLHLAMPEDGFTRPTARAHGGSLRTALATVSSGRRVVAAHPVLVLVLAIAFLFGMWAEGFDRLKEAHFLLEVGLPELFSLESVVWFGVLRAGTMILSFAVAAPLVASVEALGQAKLVRLLIAFHLLLIVAALSFALVGEVWPAIAAYWFTTVVRELIEAPYRTWLNTAITDSSVRATVLSIASVSGSAGEWGGGPVLGWVATRWTIRTSLAAGALMLAPALLLLGRAAAHQGRDPDLTDVESTAVR